VAKWRPSPLPGICCARKTGIDARYRDPLDVPVLAGAARLSPAHFSRNDQDEALAFYTEKLGMELRDDVTLPELGGFRWLTVGPPAARRRSRS